MARWTKDAFGFWKQVPISVPVPSGDQERSSKDTGTKPKVPSKPPKQRPTKEKETKSRLLFVTSDDDEHPAATWGTVLDDKLRLRGSRVRERSPGRPPELRTPCSQLTNAGVEQNRATSHAGLTKPRVKSMNSHVDQVRGSANDTNVRPLSSPFGQGRGRGAANNTKPLSSQLDTEGGKALSHRNLSNQARGFGGPLDLRAPSGQLSNAGVEQNSATSNDGFIKPSVKSLISHFDQDRGTANGTIIRGPVNGTSAKPLSNAFGQGSGRETANDTSVRGTVNVTSAKPVSSAFGQGRVRVTANDRRTVIVTSSKPFSSPFGQGRGREAANDTSDKNSFSCRGIINDTNVKPLRSQLDLEGGKASSHKKISDQARGFGVRTLRPKTEQVKGRQKDDMDKSSATTIEKGGKAKSCNDLTNVQQIKPFRGKTAAGSQESEKRPSRSSLGVHSSSENKSRSSSSIQPRSEGKKQLTTGKENLDGKRYTKERSTGTGGKEKSRRNTDGLLSKDVRLHDTAKRPKIDYRKISVMPTQEDLENDRPFLRENRMNGYESNLQYLDTQFRLMREDLLAPLREGVKEHLKSLRDGKRLSRLQDGFIYRDVQFLGIDTNTESGLAYVIRFTVDRLRNIQWDNTKRLMYGNMVCLSADDFKTVYFATIVDRDSNALRRGLLSIKIEGITTLPIAQRVRSFVMIEATSYLEAYKYVLARLQSIGMDVENGKDVPFQRYIVDCESDIKPPDYLNKNTAIHIPTPDGRQKEIIALNTRSWSTVTPKTFELDDSQFAALRHALLSDMALIQGPPGTGKTFIGLKIMDILLKNKHVWKGLENHGHIMVICFTNHALDQFLEGILELQKRKPSLVRIGGRSKSESVAKYSLRELCYQDRRSLPQDYWDKYKEIRNDLGKIAEKIKRNKELASLEPLKVPPEMLKQHMTTKQVLSLTLSYQFDSKPLGVLLRWLAGWDGKSEQTWDDRTHKFSLDAPNAPKAPAAVEDNGSEEDEGDIEEDTQDTRSRRREDNAHDSDSDNNLISMAGEADLIQSERIVDDECQKGSDLYREYLSRCNESDNRQWWTAATSMTRDRKGIMKKTTEPDTNQLIDSYCESILKNAIPMDPGVAARTNKLWNLSQQERFNLFLHWCDSFFKNLDVTLAYDLQEQEALLNELKAIQLYRDCHVISKYDVIGMTTTGAAKYTEMVQRIRPQVVIVEEAAEVLEAHIVTALTDNCKHLILIGDHKQLRPNPTVYELARDYRLNISLFERMIENNMEVKTLRLQHRMRPDISQFLVPWIYEELIDHESVKQYPSIRGIKDSVIFFDHDRPETGSSESRSQSNDFEADFVVGLCKYFLQQEYEPRQITILTTYSGQMTNIRKRIPKTVFEGVRVTSVDNYQGEENDIIILSFVRSNNQRNIGFLKQPNRVCVAMSRAKMGFYALGNFTMYASKSDTWSGMVSDMQKYNCLKKYVTLLCQNHPESETRIATADDFNKVPNGGCTLPCGFKLKCGHVCSQKCHIKDTKHEGFKCQKPCRKICNRGIHRCKKKCWEMCICEAACPEILECDHQCQNFCSQQCTKLCMAPCDQNLGCGHKCTRRCSERCGPCMQECERKKTCGHRCPGKCGEVCRDVPCKKPCRKSLKCGHICTKTCSMPCRPCNQSCSKKLPCGHSCKNKCSIECTAPCVEMCQKILPCGHKNMVPCSMNNREDLAKICTAKVVKKANCGHMVNCLCNEVPDRKLCTKIVFDIPKNCGHFVKVKCCDKGKGVCRQNVIKILPCKHEALVECFRDVSDVICSAMVSLDPGCRHEQALKCSERRSFICRKPVMHKFRCGHEQKIECHMKGTATCLSECGYYLPCTHKCMGSCSQCKIAGKHSSCKQACEKNLRCGHRCEKNCGHERACGPCVSRCEMKCWHGPCRKKCNADCTPCDKPCGWICPHARCTRICHETCNRDPCNEPCREKLPSCGHLCPGLCGEPCPFTCIKCHPVLFKNPKETTRYIRVQPCNHTVPVDVMDEAMKEKQSGTFTVVEPKQCPADGCGRVVLFCPRYSNIIKAYLKIMRKTDEGKKWLRCRRCSEVSSFNKDDIRPYCRNC